MADDKAKTGLAAGAGGAFGAALALLATRPKPAEAAPGDEAVLLLLQAIAESVAAIAAAMGVSALKNPNEIVCFRVLVPVINTPIQLPDYPIPFDTHIVIKAFPINRGVMYTANSRAEAMNPNSSYLLLANEAIEYKIERTGQLWVNASIAGEGVVCTVEQRRPGG